LFFTTQFDDFRRKTERKKESDQERGRKKVSETMIGLVVLLSVTALSMARLHVKSMVMTRVGRGRIESAEQIRPERLLSLLGIRGASTAGVDSNHCEYGHARVVHRSGRAAD
jgi:hypothetical protein